MEYKRIERELRELRSAAPKRLPVFEGPTFEHAGAKWTARVRGTGDVDPRYLVVGPLCVDCQSDLWFGGYWAGDDAECLPCKKRVPFPGRIDSSRDQAEILAKDLWRRRRADFKQLEVLE